MAEEIYTTIKFDEAEAKIKEYSLPIDFDWAELSSDLDKVEAANDPEPGFLRLTYRDYGANGPWVLLSVNVVLDNGLVDALAQWVTGQTNYALDTIFDPAVVAAATAMPVPGLPPPATFKECWADSTWSSTFTDWARAENIGEPVDFLIWLQQSYKPSPSWDWADYLMNNYVLPTSSEPLNIDNATVEATKRKFPVALGRQRAMPPADAFDAVEADVYALLGGIYMRFVRAQSGG